jgi:hypothetical protein
MMMSLSQTNMIDGNNIVQLQLQDTTDNVGVDISLSKLNLNDPGTWISNIIVHQVIIKGVDQGKDFNYHKSVDAKNRHFSVEWFEKKLQNGDVVNRDWLLYSKNQKAVFCVPCILFSKKQRTPNTGNREKGIRKWKHIGE